MTRSGIVAVVGAPNAGKSTLLNRIVGQKLAITSRKPQSTRDRVVGIVTTPDSQMILLDTPGLLEPKYALQEAMRSASLAALNDADVIVHLVDGASGVPASLTEAARLDKPPRVHVIPAINKSDLLSAGRRAQLAGENPGAVFLSARTGDGVEELMVRLRESLPESPFLYPEDDVSTQSVRFFVAELVRETVLEQLHDEVPYSVAVAIEEFREGRSPVYIRAVVFVERESQKRIVIGAGASRIRDVGKAARAKIEQLVGEAVYLDLHVKVLPNWRRSTQKLERLGYHAAKGGRK